MTHYVSPFESIAYFYLPNIKSSKGKLPGKSVRTNGRAFRLSPHSIVTTIFDSSNLDYPRSKEQFLRSLTLRPLTVETWRRLQEI